MILKLFSLLLLLTLTGSCSLQQPKNTWQYKSVTAFEKYQQYYLENQLILATSERKKAISFAKQSAHLNTLARVYLGDCAIQYAALNKTQCKTYQQVAPIAQDAELNAYFHLLTQQLTPAQIPKLPKRYQGFASALLSQNRQKINAEVIKIEELHSKLIAASIAQSELALTTIRALIDETADHGYQLASLRWMTFLASVTPDSEESKQLHYKIALMTRLE